MVSLMTHPRHATALMALAISVIAPGCAQKQVVSRELEIDRNGKIGIVAYASALRGAYLFPAGVNYRYCAEPPPDTALQTIQELSGKLKGAVAEQGSGEAEFTSKVAASAFELAGRTQLVLLARELLYRICELSLNYPGLTGTEAAGLYTTVAAVVENLAERDRAEAVAGLYRAREAARALIQDQDTKVETILRQVETGGQLDLAKLAALVEKAKDHGLTSSQADQINRQPTLADLRALLSDDLDDAIEPLHEAL